MNKQESKLQGFFFEIQYKKGINNASANFLSMLSIVELGWKKELLAVCAKDERAADRLQNSKKNLGGG